MTLSEINRFESKINKTNTCWLWTGGLTEGYGRFRFNGFMLGAHRFSWRLYRGPIPKDLFVLHSCDVRSCVNPEHLFLGTHTDNVLDAIKKRHYYGGKKERNVPRILNKEQEREVMKLYKETDKTQQIIASLYEVGQSSISRIVRRS